MHYTLRVNEQQFGDLIAAIICAEAAEAEAIEDNVYSWKNPK